MPKPTKRDSAEIRYLLGNLSEDEKTRLEDAFFADDTQFEELEVAEDELLDAYARKELTAEERKQFETRLRTSPRLRERVNFASAFAKRTGSITPPVTEDVIEPAQNSTQAKTTRWWSGFFAPQPSWGMALTAGAVVMILGGLVLVPGWLQLRKESERLASEQAALKQQKEDLDKRILEQQDKSQQAIADLQKEREQLAAERERIVALQRATKGRPQSQSLGGAIAFLVLASGTLRDPGQLHELAIGPGATKANLRLQLESNQFRQYRAMLANADRHVVFTSPLLKPRGAGSYLMLTIPVQHLSPGNYIINVVGSNHRGAFEDAGDYSFRVTKK